MTQLNDNQAQAVVDGILEGYKNYLQERKEKKASMRVSYAYAFTKGNHIDDAVVGKLEKLITKATLDKVKGGWEQFEFTFENGVSCFFIIKDALRARAATKQGNNESNYLLEYAELLNSNWIKEEGLRENQPKEENVIIQLNMLSELEKKQLDKRNQIKNHERFYLIIYEINKLKMITRIDMVALDAETRALYQIQDLSPYIQTSDVEVTELEASVVLNDSEDAFMDEYFYNPLSTEKEKKQEN